MVEAEKVKRIKKEPKENAKKSKSKPNITSDKTLKTPMVIPKKRVPKSKRQPLGELNYQIIEQSTSPNNVKESIHENPMTVPMNIPNMEETYETYSNGAIIDGQLMFQSADGSYQYVYIDEGNVNNIL